MPLITIAQTVVTTFIVPDDREVRVQVHDAILETIADDDLRSVHRQALGDVYNQFIDTDSQDTHLEVYAGPFKGTKAIMSQVASHCGTAGCEAPVNDLNGKGLCDGCDVKDCEGGQAQAMQMAENMAKHGTIDAPKDAAVAPPHPIQPLYMENGVIRFKRNSIVRKLLDLCTANGYSLNEIVRDPATTREDIVQLYQLIGYSLSGYGELQAVTDTDYEAAELMVGHENLGHQQARIDALETRLGEIRALLATPVAILYGVHEDDLKHGRP